MKSFLFPDINVWLALSVDRHIHNPAAKGWFDKLGSGSRLFFCRFTQLGLLRLLSSESVMGQAVRDQPGAWQDYDRWLQDDRVEFLEEPVGLEVAFRGLSQMQRPAPKDWADSYLAAFAESAQLTLVTFDRALHRRSDNARLLL